MNKPAIRPCRNNLEELVKVDLNHRKIKYGYETEKLYYHKELCPHCGKSLSRKLSSYTPDFILYGRLPVVVEVKGRFDISMRKQFLAIKRDNPKADIRFLFQGDSVIRKGSKTRITEWCAANGFPSAVGYQIPESWIPKDNKKGKQ